MVLYTNFPYLADEEDFKKFKEAGIEIETVEITEELDFVDLPNKSGSENETHRALKKLGSGLLCKLGATDIAFENYFIDVSSKTLQIAIECGDTPIGRVWSMLFNDFSSHWIKEVWCLYLESGKIELVKFIKSRSILDYEKKIGWRG